MHGLFGGQTKYPMQSSNTETAWAHDVANLVRGKVKRRRWRQRESEWPCAGLQPEIVGLTKQKDMWGYSWARNEGSLVELGSDRNFAGPCHNISVFPKIDY